MLKMLPLLLLSLLVVPVFAQDKSKPAGSKDAGGVPVQKETYYVRTHWGGGKATIKVSVDGDVVRTSNEKGTDASGDDRWTLQLVPGKHSVSVECFNVEKPCGYHVQFHEDAIGKDYNAGIFASIDHPDTTPNDTKVIEFLSHNQAKVLNLAEAAALTKSSKPGVYDLSDSGREISTIVVPPGRPVVVSVEFQCAWEHEVWVTDGSDEREKRASTWNRYDKTVWSRGDWKYENKGRTDAVFHLRGCYKQADPTTPSDNASSKPWIDYSKEQRQVISARRDALDVDLFDHQPRKSWNTRVRIKWD